MTDEEAQKLREDLETAKAASAFLYLALEELGKILFDLPRLMAAEARLGGMDDRDQEEFASSVGRLNEWVRNAHKCIWDEDGKPR